MLNDNFSNIKAINNKFNIDENHLQLRTFGEVTLTILNPDNTVTLPPIVQNIQDVINGLNSGEFGEIINKADCAAGIETACISYYIDESEVQTALIPTVQAAKSYLYTKGFTEQEITTMIIEENGQLEDLIPLAMLMANYENSQNSTALNYKLSFFTSAYAQEGLGGLGWQDYAQCASIAIGADLIWSIGGDSSKWTKKAIGKAFKKIAQRFLGPIGVAIAVGTFAYCIADRAYFQE